MATKIRYTATLPEAQGQNVTIPDFRVTATLKWMDDAGVERLYTGTVRFSVLFNWMRTNNPALFTLFLRRFFSEYIRHQMGVMND